MTEPWREASMTPDPISRPDAKRFSRDELVKMSTCKVGDWFYGIGELDTAFTVKTLQTIAKLLLAQMSGSFARISALESEAAKQFLQLKRREKEAFDNGIKASQLEGEVAKLKAENRRRERQAFREGIRMSQSQSADERQLAEELSQCEDKCERLTGQRDRLVKACKLRDQLHREPASNENAIAVLGGHCICEGCEPYRDALAECEANK